MFLEGLTSLQYFYFMAAIVSQFRIQHKDGEICENWMIFGVDEGSVLPGYVNYRMNKGYPI